MKNNSGQRKLLKKFGCDNMKGYKINHIILLFITSVEQNVMVKHSENQLVINSGIYIYIYTEIF